MSSASPEPDAGAAAGSPSEFLKNIVGKRVKVRIGSGVDYHGLLTCLDGYMNVALEETEEWAGGRKTAEYGDCFLRGNNVLYISALEDL
ncbi:U6 snRNA-associated Sm-like protein LSm6 [Kwoniella shandongensis]|uniref:U6 snRNA-associated Sm-like protein LSm6 n=1 Tax=Kwoniella shandongensis TaxID=1734106 RepID=A0A5M6C8F7_9TREE|nr:U6 snRNA-associated Sm-like protein LSm6 [Kwoniella shandongensis]KAA5531438.1 U6 snRNA-associated Sm-like protein LSm6 [Kwoniella shandongensis]